MSIQTTTEYCEIVRAAHDTATKLLNRGLEFGAPGTFQVVVNTEGGQTACVTWRAHRVIMSLPSFKPDTRLTRIEADRIVGFIAHEACHVRHTSNRAWEIACREGAQITRLVNAMEDVRIEAAEIATGYLPNLRNVLSETLNAKHWEALQSRRAGNLPAVGSVASDVAYVLCVLGRLANGYTVPCAAGLEKGIAPELRPIVAYALKRMPKLTDTMGVVRLAREITARLKALQGPQGQPSQPGEQGKPEGEQGQPGEGQPEGEAGEGQPGEGQPEGEAGEGQPGEGQPGEGQPEGEAGESEDTASAAQDDATGEEAASGDGDTQDDATAAQPASKASPERSASEASASEGEPEASPERSASEASASEGEPEASRPGDDDRKPAQPGDGVGGTGEVPAIEPDAAGLDSLVRAASERTGDTGLHRDLSPLNTFAGAERSQLRPAQGGEGYVAALRALAPKPAALRNQVAQIIRSQERHGHERFRSVGRLDRRSLSRVAIGATNVYTRRTFVAGVDTAVVVLIDGSGSMTHAMPLAHLMALHLAEAIEAARGKVCVAGFWGRQDSVSLAIAKGFNEKLDPTRLASFNAATSTPLSVSLLGAADLLREVHAQRKIILVLTDGGCDLGRDCVRSAVALVNKRGVECAGIGIQEDVSYAFPVHTMVTSPSQLATEGLATLVRAIEAGRAKA